MNKVVVEKKHPPTLVHEIKPDVLLKKLHSAESRIAEVISTFSGNMLFVYFHVVWFAVWILINQGFFYPTVEPFDPFPYGLLTMVVSLEAIFLSTFILINQNRQVLIEEFKDLEEEKEEQEAEEEVEDIQKDLDDIKNAIAFIQQKVTQVEKAKGEASGNGGGTSSNPSSEH